MTKDFSVIMTNTLADVQLLANGQCFPLNWIEELKTGKINNQNKDLFSSQSEIAQSTNTSYAISDAITEDALDYFVNHYKNREISKEDLFYYIYGLLHSHEYKARYADNLSKEFPKIPAVKGFQEFVAFRDAGKKLGDMHLNYEEAALYPVTFESEMVGLTDSDYRVTQMKFAEKGNKSRVIYNHKITMSDIPLEAYDYVVNGKSALEWVMERQAITTHKDSGIVNDANDWAIETMNDPAYPLKLFQSVITISLETMKIVNSLPKLDI